ncbi:MAG: amidohydrolase family protein [Candidatus Cybelea sp.]|jgi:imidazolonepropionase-like amidohydrolase
MGDDRTLLEGCTVFVEPGRRPLHDATILLEREFVAAVSSNAPATQAAGTRLDCSGATALAAFWNCHVHFFERKWADAATIPANELESQLESLTRYGFTSVFDLSSLWANTRSIRERTRTNEIRGPQIYSTGEGLIPPGALPPKIVTKMMGIMDIPMPEVTCAGDATTAARKLLNAGVDGVKLFASGSGSGAGTVMSAEVMRAAVEEAHRCNKPVFVHPNTDDDVLNALSAGVDVIAHTTPSHPWHQNITEIVSRQRLALIPTLALWEHFFRHDRRSTQERILAAAIEQLETWVEAGGTVLFGTDYGAVDPDPSSEYRLMTAAGMDFHQILASLTTNPADRFARSSKLGRIAPGYQADIVVLNGDPSSDIAALTNVRYVIRRGKVIYLTSIDPRVP